MAYQMKVAPDLESLLDTHVTPFILIDRDYRIVAANRKYLERYHLTDPAKVIGRKCHEVSHHSTRPCHLNGEDCPHKHVFETGAPHDVLHCHYDERGGKEYVSIHATPVYSPDGALTYMGEALCVRACTEELRFENLEMVGTSPAFAQLVGHLCAAAESDAPVLITGETGVGKELAAQLVHRKSARAAHPFVPVDCTVLTEELFANELFGHERGAFTGCVGRKPGLFELANHGTLFLDEIGDLPPRIQTKLLRVLETGRFRRVGGTALLKADVRLVCATNRDLKQMVEEGTFRADLYYRIAGLHIEIPPLRFRRQDIPLLVDHLSACRGKRGGWNRFSPQAREWLMSYDYPGNVRELRNIVERAELLARDAHIEPHHLPPELAPGAAPRHKPAAPARQCASARGIGTEELREALARFNGNRREAAQWLGLSERTLYRRLRELRAGEVSKITRVA